MNEPGIDLTGKLIIKTALGDDIRRILITNEDITYDELVLMMQRVYRGKLSSSDDIVIKYKDEDNDLITIFDSSDLSFAIQCSRILKITLYVNGKPEPMQSDEVKMIKSELRHIRDCCTQLLDKLDDRPPGNDGPSTTSAVDSTTPRGVPSKKVVAESPRQTTPQPSVAAPISGAGSKEFDPLSSQRSVDGDQQKVMSSFGISASEGQDRPGTPDSVSSIGSGSSRPQQPGGTPVHQGGQAGVYQPGSGQKAQPPWLQQQQNGPSSYSQGPQEFSPVVMRSQHIPMAISAGQNVVAGRSSPYSFTSSGDHQHALMQSHAYTGHEQTQSYHPTPHSYAPASSPQQQTSGYTGQPQTSQPQAQGSQGPQPGQQPGYPPQGAAGPQGPQTSQPGYGQPVQPGTSQYGAFNQPGGQMSGQPSVPGAPSPRFGAPASQQQQQQPYTGQQQMAPGQQQPGPQPGQYNYQQQPSGAPSQPQQGPQGANPYARPGPGYGTGYPRPAGNYPQGYQ